MTARKDTLATGRDDTGEEDEMMQAQTVSAEELARRERSDTRTGDAPVERVVDDELGAPADEHEAARNERLEPGPTWQKTG